MNKKNKSLIILFLFFATILTCQGVAAQGFGLSEFSQGVNGALPTEIVDLRVLAGRLIQIILSFLGVIAVSLILYAGFKWMTSGGSEEKIKAAQATLKSALIGLVIIMSSWAIVSFIMSQLLGALSGGTPNYPSNNPGTLSSAGLSAFGVCSVENVYPAPGAHDVARNTNIMISFKEEIKLEQLCYDNNNVPCTCNSSNCKKINPQIIQIYKTELGNAASTNIKDVVVNIPSGGKTLVLMPLSALGSVTANTDYSIKITEGLKKKVNGQSMFTGCGANNVAWNFEVSNILDLTPPRILAGQTFPNPDNNQDGAALITPAVAAQGSIVVSACPQFFSAAKLIRVNPDSGSSNAIVDLNYRGSIAAFKVVVGNDNQALLFDGNNNALGNTVFNNSSQASFSGYFSIEVGEVIVGNSWSIDIAPEQRADTLTLNSDVYTFATSSVNNNIEVPAVCDKATVAANIAEKLNGETIKAVQATGLENNKVNLTANTAGPSGNDITLSSDSTNLIISTLSGGQDGSSSIQVNDKQDKPMNSVIQINFSEAINPISVSGLASEVKDSIQVVNASAGDQYVEGYYCTSNSDCLSYKCENTSCVGSYLAGRFILSNAYRTLEFISDSECGVNGCGEKIYCLPPKSNLKVKVKAADLNTCSGDSCLSFAPFNSCSDNSSLRHKTCQDIVLNKNYPLAESISMTGVRDTANNSLDGNRDDNTQGPATSYNENMPASSTGDSYHWSFFISDKLENSTPEITSILPTQSASGVNLADPIKIAFNKLMMVSSLRTGSVIIDNTGSTTEHRLLNLRTAAPTAVGYWVSADNQDTAPLDGEPDITLAQINHSPFLESFTFMAQAGSGLKDIYQNCYKPSAGPGTCSPVTVNAEKPSCCFGVPTAELGADGNCQ